jgi:uncharacterized membrane protein
MFALFLPTLVIPALFLAIPFLPSGRFFSMEVTPSWRNSAEARRIRFLYLSMVALVAAISTALSFVTADHKWLLYPIPLLEVAGVLAAWSWGWRRTLPHRVAAPILRSASLTLNQPVLPAVLVTAASSLPILAVAIYLRLHYDDIPPAFPVHFDANGMPNHMVSRTIPHVFGPPLIAAVTIWFLAAMLFAISRRSAGIADQGSYASLTRRAVAGAAWILALTVSVVSFLPVAPVPGHLAGQLSYVSSGFLLLLILANFGYFARRGTVLSTAQATTADEHWKAGLWYYNPNDAALFVPKRIGFGYTLNMAHPTAWLLMGATLLLTAIPLVLKHL